MQTRPAFRASCAQVWKVPRWAVKAAVVELHRERLAIASSSAPGRAEGAGTVALGLLFRRRPSGDLILPRGTINRERIC